MIMELQDAINFIQHKDLSLPTASVWADLGCGKGTFTAALARYLQPGSTIYAADLELPRGLERIVPAGINVQPVQLDFVKEQWPFSQLDGIVMGNALHYVKEQSAFIERIKDALVPGGRLLIVEYDTDKPVPQWVPYPLSYQSLEKLFSAHGFHNIEKLHTRTSVYGNADLYTALLRK